MGVCAQRPDVGDATEAAAVPVAGAGTSFSVGGSGSGSSGAGRQPRGPGRNRGRHLSSSAPPSLLVPVPAADRGAGAGTRGCLPPCALRLQGLPQWTRAHAAQPSRTVIVPSSSVQGQLGPKPPARDCAPSFSQREAVSSRKNRVSVAGPLAPSAGAWKLGGGRCGRAARSRPPWPAVWRGPGLQPLWASRL